jgi:hypothetical protein
LIDTFSGLGLLLFTNIFVVMMSCDEQADSNVEWSTRGKSTHDIVQQVIVE